MACLRHMTLKLLENSLSTIQTSARGRHPSPQRTSLSSQHIAPANLLRRLDSNLIIFRQFRSTVAAYFGDPIVDTKVHPRSCRRRQ